MSSATLGYVSPELEVGCRDNHSIYEQQRKTREPVKEHNAPAAQQKSSSHTEFVRNITHSLVQAVMHPPDSARHFSQPPSPSFSVDILDDDNIT